MDEAPTFLQPDLMNNGDAKRRVDQARAIDRATSGLAGAAGRLLPIDKNNHAIPLTEFCWWAISADDALEQAIGRQPSEVPAMPTPMAN